jgi:hypothetical protein
VEWLKWNHPRPARPRKMLPTYRRHRHRHRRNAIRRPTSGCGCALLPSGTEPVQGRSPRRVPAGNRRWTDGCRRSSDARRDPPGSPGTPCRLRSVRLPGRLPGPGAHRRGHRLLGFRTRRRRHLRRGSCPGLPGIHAGVGWPNSSRCRPTRRSPTDRTDPVRTKPPRARPICRLPTGRQRCVAPPAHGPEPCRLGVWATGVAPAPRASAR